MMLRLRFVCGSRLWARVSKCLLLFLPVSFSCTAPPLIYRYSPHSVCELRSVTTVVSSYYRHHTAHRFSLISPVPSRHFQIKLIIRAYGNHPSSSGTYEDLHRRTYTSHS